MRLQMWWNIYIIYKCLHSPWWDGEACSSLKVFLMKTFDFWLWSKISFWYHRKVYKKRLECCLHRRSTLDVILQPFFHPTFRCGIIQFLERSGKIPFMFIWQPHTVCATHWFAVLLTTLIDHCPTLRDLMWFMFLDKQSYSLLDEDAATDCVSIQAHNSTLWSRLQ